MVYGVCEGVGIKILGLWPVMIWVQAVPKNGVKVCGFKFWSTRRWWLNFFLGDQACRTRAQVFEGKVEKAVKVKTVEVTCEGCGSQVVVSCPYTGVCSWCRFSDLKLVSWEMLNHLLLKFYMDALINLDNISSFNGYFNIRTGLSWSPDSSPSKRQGVHDGGLRWWIPRHHWGRHRRARLGDDEVGALGGTDWWLLCCFSREGLLFLAKPWPFPVMFCNYHSLLAVDGQQVEVRWVIAQTFSTLRADSSGWEVHGNGWFPAIQVVVHHDFGPGEVMILSWITAPRAWPHARGNATSTGLAWPISGRSLGTRIPHHWGPPWVW